MSIQLTPEEIKNARCRLEKAIRHTPLAKNLRYSQLFNADIHFKREDLQLVRSYKIRGAYNKIALLQKGKKNLSVVCASAGNHAQGVAYACQVLGVQGKIFMPVTTPKQKVEQVRMFGGENTEIILIRDVFDDTQEEALKYAEMHKLAFIHPFDDPDIIQGQATVGLEILESLQKPIDYLVVPVGGGGLVAGLIAIFKQLSPYTRVIGVEPSGAASMSLALQAGWNAPLETVDCFVDGTAVRKVGAHPFQICKTGLHRMLQVDAGKVCEVILELYNRDAIVAEPSGALAVAALDQLAGEIQNKRVVCIISGGNNDISRMEEIKERALLYSGLKHYFLVRFPQRAGALKDFVLNVPGPYDDITHFEYIKKNAREKGAAIVGIELKNSIDFDPLIQRMKQGNFYGEYLNKNESLMSVLV